jgi:hypothetical protein
MKYRIPLTLGLMVAFVAGAWMALRPPDLPELPSEPGQAPAVAQPRASARVPTQPKLTAASVLAIDPRAGPARGSVAPRATLFTEYLAAKQYKPIYDRLKSSPEGQTAEGWYVMYEMLRKCATITERTSRAPIVRSTDQKRDEFVASIPGNDPQRDKRIAAFDDVAANRCAGMEGVTIAQADLNKLLANAAGAGDPKAQALAIEQELWAARRASGPDGRWGRDTVTVSDAQVESLRQIATTRDPEAMLIAGRILSNSWADFSMRIGPDNQLVEQRAFMQAWQLLACDYGYPCGENNPRVLSACAYQGHCNTTSLPDYLFYYGASPHDSQLLSQYREVLRTAVESGNWSQVSVVRGPAPAGTGRFMFRQGG